jgi:hypothetical protein
MVPKWAADAVVADGQRPGLFIEADAHFQVRVVFEQRRVVQRLETQLVAGVAGVAHQLAQEDLLVGVQRVRDEVEDLLDFGLECVGLFLAHGLAGGQETRECGTCRRHAAAR